MGSRLAAGRDRGPFHPGAGRPRDANRRGQPARRGLPVARGPGRQPADVVDALFDISVADRINPSLARTLTGRADAGELLLQAEARGLFVSRLDVEGWSEVHSLIRGALVDELARRSPGRLDELHVTAATWFEGMGETPLALEHWLLANRPREALRLLAARTAELYDRGREMTIVRTIADIPQEVAAADLDRMVQYALCHLLVDRRRFVEIVDQATWWAAESPPTDTDGAHLSMLQSMAATLGGTLGRGRRAGPPRDDRTGP